MQILLQFQRSNSNIDFNLFPVPVRNTGKIRLSLINMTNRMTYQLVSWNSNNTARYLILHPTTLLLRGFVITLVPQKRVCPKVPSRGHKAPKKKKTINPTYNGFKMSQGKSEPVLVKVTQIRFAANRKRPQAISYLKEL